MFAIKVSSRSVGLAASAFLFMSLPSVTFADDPPYEQVFSNKSATGEELVSAFLNLASHTGSPTGTVGTTKEQDKASKSLVEPYLDPAFQLQRASGQRYTAENFLPADLGSGLID